MVPRADHQVVRQEGRLAHEREIIFELPHRTTVFPIQGTSNAKYSLSGEAEPCSKHECG